MGETFYDLGCGNGRTLIEAAKLGAKATGYEISPYYYIYTYIHVRIRITRYKNISVKYRHIKKVNLSKADVVYCYLLPEMLEKLAIKFKRELKPGSRLVSIGFPIKGSSSREYDVDSRKIFIVSS